MFETAIPPVAPPVDEQAALELPVDFARARGLTRVLAVHAFELPELGEDPRKLATPDALIAGAFAAQLHRYSGQASIPVQLARTGAGGETRWAAAVRLETPDGGTARSLVTQLDAVLARPMHERAAACRAAITWI